MQIYVSKDGQRYGPYSLAELRKEVASNVFKPEHFASCDKGRSWIPISAVPGIGPLVHSVEIDAANNLLIIRYWARVGSSAVECCAEEVGAALAGLRPGFRLLADFTELESMDVTCAPHLERIMELCDGKGVSMVVRIISHPKQDIGLQIMSYFHYRPDVRIKTCKSLEEATEILGLKK